MSFFGMIFWLVVLWCVFSMWRRRRWERWAMSVPPGYRPYSWWESRELSRDERGSRRNSKQDDHQAYIEALESRVSDLEERLDFTERLLANRRQTASAEVRGDS